MDKSQDQYSCGTFMDGIREKTPLQLENTVFVRTVTHYFVGRIVGFTGMELYLDHCAWIADTGKFDEFIEQGEPDEHVGYPKTDLVSVNRMAVVDMHVWDHELLFLGSPMNLKLNKTSD